MLNSRIESCLQAGSSSAPLAIQLLALIRSLRITILENQLRQFGAKNESIASAIRKEYEELFFPAEERWREKALADGRQAVEGILRAHNFWNNLPIDATKNHLRRSTI